jgi:chloramphenicol 3-O phosphotransferase
MPATLRRVAAGKVILLHGTSSSGKTTIARAFQRRASEAWVRLGIDVFWNAVDARWMEFGPRADEGFRWVERDDSVAIVSGPVGQLLAAATRASVSVTARAGLSVIADDVLIDRAWLAEWAEALAGLETLFVGVHTPLDVLERRERERGDRILGEARGQHGVIHTGIAYDVEVNTAASDADEGARIIERALATAPHPRALARLRRD